MKTLYVPGNEVLGCEMRDMFLFLTSNARWLKQLTKMSDISGITVAAIAFELATILSNGYDASVSYSFPQGLEYKKY
jgi:hypothetical protein